MAHSDSSQRNKAICLPPLRLFVARAAILLNPDSIVCGKAMCWLHQNAGDKFSSA